MLATKKLPSSSMSSVTSSPSFIHPSSEEFPEISLSQKSSTGNSTTTTPRTIPSKRRMGRTPIEKFIDNITKDQSEDLHTKLSAFFFGCNIPFSVCESDHFINFVKALRPAYASKIPGRKNLSTTLLDKEYQRCIDLTKNLINPDSVLLIDGWKNTSSNSKTVVSMLHNAKGSQAFLNAWDLTGESETSDKLTEIVNESIILAKELYKTEVYAVISDNAASMVKMGRNVPIWHSNCSSHTANLLAKDVMDLDLTKKVTAVLKEFKHADFERALVDKGGSRIKTPCDTRWCSYRDSYHCLVKNIHFMKTLIVNDARFKKIKQTVKTLIFDDDFLDEVTNNVKLFDPICNLINFAQKSDSSSADVAHLWLSLELPDNFIKFQDKLECRKKMALNVYVLCAYYLHPKYHEIENANKKLSVEQLKVIQDFLVENLDADGMMSYYKYQKKSGIFKTLFDKNITNPLVFWSMANIHHPNLSSLALKLEKIPASSAQIERIFSNWSFVHSPLRNRLEFNRSKKLLHVYYTHKILDSNKSEDY